MFRVPKERKQEIKHKGEQETRLEIVRSAQRSRGKGEVEQREANISTALYMSQEIECPDDVEECIRVLYRVSMHIDFFHCA